MIDSMIEPQPVEGRGINTISQKRGPACRIRRSPTPAPHFPIATLTSSAWRKEDAPVTTPVTATQHTPEAVTACMLTRSISNQAMHRSTSFRALVLFGVVALVTALYQSITPPSLALTIPTGLTPRQRVKLTRSYAFEFDAAGRSSGGFSLRATNPLIGT